MITKTEEKIIKQCAKKYNLASVLLFGSSLERGRSHDIDLGIEGIKPELFFKFYGELFKRLERPVDLVDLNETDSYFVKCVLEKGRVIYEARI